LIYVVQNVPGRNITPALQYGELCPDALLESGAVALSPGPMVRRLQRKLALFNDKDYLLCMGDPVAIGMAVMVASQMNQGKVALLRWDRQTFVYFPVRVDVNQNVRKDVHEPVQ
jgi:hypothetical protein